MQEQSLKNQVLESSKIHKEEFQKSTGGFEDRGILNSEMLAICGLSESLGVEVFIESGRWRGQSTEILSKYFQNKSIIIESIELFRDKNAIHVEKKMQNRKNVKLLYGDANYKVTELVKKYSGKKIAILFDGPKGKQAIDVFRLALTFSNSIVVGFFHDMRKSTPDMLNSERLAMENIFPKCYFTDDKDFVKEFSIIDVGCQTALWRPYLIDGKKIGSYGPTVGIVLPSRYDYQKANKEKMSLYWKAIKRSMFSYGIKVYHLFFGVIDQ